MSLDYVKMREEGPKELEPDFLALQQQAFSDWNTPEADDAFRDL